MIALVIVACAVVIAVVAVAVVHTVVSRRRLRAGLETLLAVEGERKARDEMERRLGEVQHENRRLAEVVATRELVIANVEPQSIVAVVSRGDPDLVQFGGRTGWHVPRDSSGTWAGYHPADSTAAIEAVESLREAGADHLLIPATSAWWLDYYVGLRPHLASRYELVADVAGVGQLWHFGNDHSQ